MGPFSAPLVPLGEAVFGSLFCFSLFTSSWSGSFGSGRRLRSGRRRDPMSLSTDNSDIKAQTPSFSFCSARQVHRRGAHFGPILGGQARKPRSGAGEAGYLSAAGVRIRLYFSKTQTPSFSFCSARQVHRRGAHFGRPGSKACHPSSTHHCRDRTSG